MLAGVAGALSAHTQRGIGTEFGYGLEQSIILLGMLVIGGLGSNLGPFLGAATVILLEDLANLVGASTGRLFPGLFGAAADVVPADFLWIGIDAFLDF
jgi:branched-chain amino acid transport system permease protein